MERAKTTMQIARERRQRMGLSQILIAKLVGVSMISVYLWERGTTTPLEENAGKLAEVLDALEVGKAVCPWGFRMGAEFDKTEACPHCAHRGDCRRYAGWLIKQSENSDQDHID